MEQLKHVYWRYRGVRHRVVDLEHVAGGVERALTSHMEQLKHVHIILINPDGYPRKTNTYKDNYASPQKKKQRRTPEAP